MGPIGVAIASSAATLFAVAITIGYGLQHIPIVGKEILPKLLVDLLVAVFWGALLAAVRYAIGWSLQPPWIFAFASGGVITYFALWWPIPSGRQRLLLYRDYFVGIFSRNKAANESSKG